MASLNRTLFLAFLAAICAFMAAPSSVEAQLPSMPGISITGTVPCTDSPTPELDRFVGFPDALAVFRCFNFTVTTVTTNNRGFFESVIRSANYISRILDKITDADTSDCGVFVPTPLVRCNASLPNFGYLVARLTRLTNNGPLIDPDNLINLVTTAFKFVDDRI